MPKQGGIQEKMNRFLSQYLPMLFQMQQRKGFVDYSQEAYLKRRLEEMAQMDQYNISGEDRSRVSNMLQNFFSTAGKETQDLPFGSGQFAERTGATAEAFGLQPLPVDPDLTSKTQEYAAVARALTLAKRTGEELPPEIVQKSVELFGLDATVSEVAKFDEALAKRIDQFHRSQEIGIKLTAAETGKTTAGTAAAKEARTAQKEVTDNWIAFITDVEDHIRQEGVALKDASGEEMQEMFRIFSTAGRFPDPLSSKTRGTVFSILGGIRARLIDGKLPTEGEKKFIAEARNTYQIEDVPGDVGGGLADPTKTTEELEVQEATIQAHMDAIRDSTGETDETTLRRLAMEFLRLIK